MFYRTTLSIYRIAPQDKAWLYSDPSSSSRPSLPALTSQSEPGSGDEPALLRAATAPGGVPDALTSPAATSDRVRTPPGRSTSAVGIAAATGASAAAMQQQSMSRDYRDPAAAATAVATGTAEDAAVAAAAAGAADASAAAAGPAGEAGAHGLHGQWLVQMSDCLPPCIGGEVLAGAGVAGKEWQGQRDYGKVALSSTAVSRPAGAMHGGMPYAYGSSLSPPEG